MKTHCRNTALLIFARTTREEEKSKTLIENKSLVNSKLINFLNKKTYSTVLSSALPVYTINENNQKGATFGERLANAFQDIFEIGFDQVIAIGNDCPELNKTDILLASQGLNDQKAVLGPDQNHGSYLIGFHKDLFDSKSFAALPWQSKSTFKALQAYLKSYSLLKPKQDLNSAIDLQRVLHGKTHRKLRTVLKRIIGIVISNRSFRTQYSNYIFYSKSFRLRGPPILYKG